MIVCARRRILGLRNASQNLNELGPGSVKCAAPGQVVAPLHGRQKLCRQLARRWRKSQRDR